MDSKIEEVIVPVANRCTLRSGSEEYVAGDYIRLVAPDGEELAYWDNLEWKEDPVGVMGAIMQASESLPKMYGESE
jgi:hypothetical protein